MTVEDKSPKGSIDTRCLPLMDLLNAKGSGYETTSSCSGRISIFAKNSGWIFVSHEPVSTATSLLDTLFPGYTVESGSDQPSSLESNDSNLVYFKFEPFILHVKAESIFPLGYEIFSLAYNLGFRNSGLTISKKNPNACTVAIRSTLKLDAPIGILDQQSKTIRLIVSCQYLGLLCQIANEKFAANFAKMDQLLSAAEKAMSNR